MRIAFTMTSFAGCFFLLMEKLEQPFLFYHRGEKCRRILEAAGILPFLSILLFHQIDGFRRAFFLSTRRKRNS
jgi:hypothetical protein